MRFKCHSKICIKLKPRDAKCIATKRWYIEDLRCALLTEGYKGTKEEIEKVVKSPILHSLNDCTDEEWNIIRTAIHDVLRK